mmetsp:Transcript_60124/g.172650  ORF Transcript_60124/g.172650 Transcript_60124/m.172650 type:complete len:210 (-) Transcript_60124:790-1419(-)
MGGASRSQTAASYEPSIQSAHKTTDIGCTTSEGTCQKRRRGHHHPTLPSQTRSWMSFSAVVGTSGQPPSDASAEAKAFFQMPMASSKGACPMPRLHASNKPRSCMTQIAAKVRTGTALPQAQFVAAPGETPGGHCAVPGKLYWLPVSSLTLHCPNSGPLPENWPLRRPTDVSCVSLPEQTLAVPLKLQNAYWPKALLTSTLHCEMTLDL